MSFYKIYEYGMLTVSSVSIKVWHFSILVDGGEDKEEKVEGDFRTVLKLLGSDGWRLCTVRYAPNGYQQDAIFIRDNLNPYGSYGELPTKEELQAYRDSQQGDHL